MRSNRFHIKPESVYQDIEQIRNELAQRYGDKPSDERIAYILDEIAVAKDDVSNPASMVRTLILIFSAFAWHVRRVQLRPDEIQKLATLARAILDACLIPSEGTALSFLHWILRHFESQILRNDGEHWSAAWVAMVAARSPSSANAGSEVHQKLIHANRLARLCHVDEAGKLYAEIAAEIADDSLRSRFAIDYGRFLRLSAQFDRARELHAQYDREISESAPEDHRLQMQWEKMCIEATHEGKIRDLLVATKKGRSHHSESYAVEAFLWAYGHKRREYMEQAYSIRSLAKNSQLKIHTLGAIYRIAVAIADCFDDEIPMTGRLEKLGEALRHRSETIGIDEELLVLAAASRALGRVRAFKFASLCSQEYQGISLRLSKGQTQDVLKLMDIG